MEESGNKYWYRGKFRKVVLTEYGEKYLRNHFPNTRNEVLMQKMDISFSTLHRFARQLGLTKTKQFMHKMQANATEFALQAWKALPSAERQRRIEIGVKNFEGHKERIWEDMRRRPLLKRLSIKRQKEVIEKIRTKRNESIASDKRRILFGLPQRTKMKLVKASSAKINARLRMVKVYKWDCGRGSSDFYEKETTVRNDVLEAKYARMYGFRFHTAETTTVEPKKNTGLMDAILNKYMVD